MKNSLKLTISTALLAGFTAHSALAATYDPAIAYTVSCAKSQCLYLANADGTNAVKIYTGTNIHGIDLAPGGGKIAITDSKGLRLLKYTSGTGIAVTSNQLLVGTTTYGSMPSAPDFSPNGAMIVFYNNVYQTNPEAIRVISESGILQLTFPCYLCSNPRWLTSDNAFAYAKTIPHGSNVAVDYEIWQGTINSYTSITSSQLLSTASQDFKGITDFDTARTSNKLLITANYPTAIRIIEFDNGAITQRLQGSVNNSHYSTDDSLIFYREKVQGGYYIASLNWNTGVSTRLTAKGNYGLVDARP